MAQYSIKHPAVVYLCVYYNDELLKYCIWADTDAGTATVYKTEVAQNGIFKLIRDQNGDPITMTLHGKIDVKLSSMAPEEIKQQYPEIQVDQ